MPSAFCCVASAEVSASREAAISSSSITAIRRTRFPRCRSISASLRSTASRSALTGSSRRVAAVIRASGVILDLHDEAAIAATDVTSPEERRLRVAVVAGRRPLVDSQPFLRGVEQLLSDEGRGDSSHTNAFLLWAEALDSLALDLVDSPTIGVSIACIDGVLEERTDRGNVPLRATSTRR